LNLSESAACNQRSEGIDPNFDSGFDPEKIHIRIDSHRRWQVENVDWVFLEKSIVEANHWQNPAISDLYGITVKNNYNLGINCMPRSQIKSTNVHHALPTWV